MPTTLELIRAERAAQKEEEARPSFRTVEAIRAFILDTKPVATKNVSLEMCVLAVEQREKCWYLTLVDQHLEADFATLMDECEGLDSSRRGKLVFQLSLWKSRDAHLNDVDYREGFTYRFDKVYSLRLLYSSVPVGSLQIRVGMQTEPVPAQVLANNRRQLRGRFSSDSGSASPSRTDAAFCAVDEELNLMTSPSNRPSKRKGRKDDGDSSASFESPTKKTRAP
ncbi:hypothetical protein PRIC2_008562 [Phytophthora ramorum]